MSRHPALKPMRDWLQAAAVPLGDHLVAKSASFLDGKGTLRTPAQARWFMDHEERAEEDALSTTCRVEGCIAHLVLESDPDERMLQLVQKESRPSLASLYRRGRAKGLIPARNDYH